MMEEFQEEVVERARAACPMEGMAEDKWIAVCTALTEAADNQLGKVKGHQPEWFQESLDELRPKLRNKVDAYTKWLAMSEREDLVQFKETRSVARKKSDRRRVHGSKKKQMRHRDSALEGRLCGSASGICRGLAEAWYHPR